MSKKVTLRENKKRRKLRVRKKVFGNASRPRLCVSRSNRYIYAQIINDEVGKTLVDISDVTKKAHQGKTKTKAAFDVGKELAKRALSKDIKKVVFDRSCYKYHGRVKSLARGAREGGLDF